MRNYNPEVLKQLQSVEIDMLERFTTICEKYDIRYFAIFGTAIGCMRHHDFIPWDDDVDIGMLKEDYEKLRAVPKSEWEPSLVLCDPFDDNEDHFFPYPRIYRLNTTLIPESFAAMIDRKRNNTGIKYNGVWIDIFVFHRFQSMKEIASVKKRAIVLRKKYLYAKKMKRIDSETSIARKLLASCENAYSFFINMLCTAPEKAIYQKYNALFKEEGDLVTTIDYPYENSPELTTLNINELLPLRRASFSGLTVFVPNNVEKNLRNIYGDYMKLPPPEKRENHAPSFLDLGEHIP